MWRKVILCAALPALASGSTALAGNDNYVGPTGTWSTDANWSLNARPAAKDVVTLSPGGSFVVVTLDVSATNLAQLTIDGLSGSPVTLAQGANTLSIAGNEITKVALPQRLRGKLKRSPARLRKR